MQLFRFRRDPTDPLEKIQRYRLARRNRRTLGISVRHDFASFAIAAIFGHGDGKYLHPEHLSSIEFAIPTALQRALMEQWDSERPDMVALAEVAHDLSQVVAASCNQFRGSLGSVGEQILAIGLADPGIWKSDFDGRPIYQPILNSELICSISGVSVIDALPAKDLVAGGQGWPLTPLPAWIAVADRRDPVAETGRVLVISGPPVEILFLPPSDGLDDYFPPVKHARLDEIDLAADVHGSVEKAMHFLRDPGWTDAPCEVFVAGPGATSIAEELGKIEASLTSVETVQRLGFSNEHFDATLVAVLSLLHIDQLPANLPWLTGAESPSILGRLTPGKPSSWRMLLREMADYHPPAMRLRDAM